MSLAQEKIIQPTVNSPGIYFDPVGSLKIIDGYLSVVVPIDISFIQPHIKNLNGVIGTSKYLCKQSNVFSDVECHNMLQPLSIRYYDIIRDFESISHLIETRSKRSPWFGGVGMLFKHLFGVMDEDDAIKYSDAIKIVENDQTQLSKLVKENILITTSTLSSVKDVVNKISVNEQQLNSAIEILSANQKNLTLLSDTLLLRSKMNEILNMLEGSLLTLSFKLEDIVNGIMFSKSHILYPSIITPKQLFSELVQNYRFLADYCQFPLSLSLKNIHMLINVSEIASFYSDNKIVFVLKVPLVTSKEFSLYNCIPFPVLITNQTYSTIIPSTKFVGITRDKSFYCKLENLSNCKVIYNLYYICENLNVYSSSASPICESEIISKALNSVPTQCQTKFLQGHLEIWQRLSNNKWIYVINERSKLTIDCPKVENSELDISGTGILNLPMNCIAYYKDSRLIPKSTNIIKLNPIYSNINLINDSCCNLKQALRTKSNISIVTLKDINLESIISEHNKATSMIVKNIDNIIDKPHIVLYGEYYSYTTIIITILIVIVISILLYKYCVKSGKCCRFLNTRFKSKLNIEKSEELSEVADESLSVPAPKIKTTLT